MTINFTTLRSASDAKGYYTPDYWIKDHAGYAFFGGKLAEMLGLKEFDLEAFHELCDGYVPGSRKGGVPGISLTQRRKADRRAGFDVTVDGPKDLGVLLALGADKRIIPEVLEAAGRDVMAAIEADAMTRVRVGGKDEDRRTGNIAYAGILHLTSRPVGGKIDMQPHIHFIVANATYDPVEKRRKAVQLQPFEGNGAKLDRPYYNALLNARLAFYMQKLGYRIERTGDTFRVVGVPERVRREFSQRTQKIEAVASELEKRKQAFMNDPTATLSPEVKGRLGAHTRERKQPGQTWDSLLEHWNDRITDGERQAVLDTVASARSPVHTPDRSKEAVHYALEHLLYRKSVVAEREVITEALKWGIGSATPEGVWAELRGRKDVIRSVEKGIPLVTTKAVLQEEKRVIAFAKQRGRFGSLGGGKIDNLLTPSQRSAIRHAWGSHDRVTLIRGLAGSGKTTMLKTLLSGVDVPWGVFATQTGASRGVLRSEGFHDADTLASLFGDKDRQERLRGGLIVLDESSQTPMREAARLFELADRLKARILIVGDKMQHKSPARGDLLSLLEDRARLPVAVVGEIKRQRGRYKQAVELLAKGKTAEGFRLLDKLGWVRQIDAPGALVSDYLTLTKRGKSVLVVSPTHAEGELVTSLIRSGLKQEGKLKGEERVFDILRPLHWTDAEKGDPGRYAPEVVARFHRSAPGFKPGQSATLSSCPELPQHAEKFSVYAPDKLALAVGDSIRATAGIKDYQGGRIDNGTAMTVAGFTEAGNIRVKMSSGGERTLPGDVLHITHNYAVTSHASQGKTVDHVLIQQGRRSFAASGKEQFYVSVSRGREAATVYTDDKAGLLEAIQQQDIRMHAVQLARKRLRERARSYLAGMLQAVGRFGQQKQQERGTEWYAFGLISKELLIKSLRIA